MLPWYLSVLAGRHDDAGTGDGSACARSLWAPTVACGRRQRLAGCCRQGGAKAKAPLPKHPAHRVVVAVVVVVVVVVTRTRRGARACARCPPPAAAGTHVSDRGNGGLGRRWWHAGGGNGAGRAAVPEWQHPSPRASARAGRWHARGQMKAGLGPDTADGCVCKRLHGRQGRQLVGSLRGAGRLSVVG